jgi:deoxyribose-phosphate aldolase
MPRLKPFMTDEDIVAACEVGKKYNVASVCVRPSDVALAAAQLAGTEVVPSTVIGFPHGANRPETKAWKRGWRSRMGLASWTW